jgi:mono/diheme cytochrome c family protein
MFMSHHRTLHLAAAIAALILLSLLASGCNFSLAGDVTPPPNYTPQPSGQSGQPVSVSTAFPLLPPDPANGAEIYVAKCLPCHGQSGMGDGPQAANLPSRPAEIGNAEFARKSRPADWYSTVTDGNLEKFMPGFSGSLDDRQRWDVVAYVYTLSASADQLDQGKTLYTQKCAECHGDSGRGDGPKASSQQNMEDWVKQDRLAQLSAVSMDAVITAGKGSMQAFTDLSQDQRWALTDYIRTLTFANGASTGQQASSNPTPSAELTPQATPAVGETTGTPQAMIGKVTLHGKISGQNGIKVPGGLAVNLVIYQGMTELKKQAATSADDGTFTFEVDNQTGLAYMAQVVYNSYTFNSDIVHASDITTANADLPVTIYETTTDASTLSIDRLHIFFDFSKASTLQVAELFIISNSGQKVVVASGPSAPPLTFKLPAGAVNLQFDSGAIGDRFVQTADGFGDLAAIAPGQSQHQVLFSYEIPYDSSLALNFSAPLPVAAAVVLIPQGGVTLTSGQLMASGTQDVQGTTYQLFTASNIANGTQLSLNLNGKVQTAGSSSQTSNPTTGLLIGLGVFGVVLIAAGVWMLRQRASNRPAAAAATAASPERGDETQEELLDAILALDDLYQAGKLPEDAYNKRRAALKERLRNVIEG